MNQRLNVELSAFELERIAKLIRYFQMVNPDAVSMSAIQVARVALDELYQSRIGTLAALTMEDCVAAYESIPASQACAQCDGTGVRVADSPCRNCYGTGVVITSAQGADAVERTAHDLPGNGQGYPARGAP